MKSINYSVFLFVTILVYSISPLEAQRQVRITAEGITNGGNEGANSSELEFKEGNFDAEIDLASDGSLRLGTGAVPSDLNINTQGYVGINTTSPSEFLDVNGDIALSDGTGRLLFMDGGTLDAYLTYNGTNLFLDNNEPGGNLELDADDVLYFQTNNSTRMSINKSGSVGIGVSAGNIPAGYLLAVDGNVIAERVRVRLSGSWPDYVFKKNYPLLPLPQLRKHIMENGHLPNIPDAITVQQEGQDLGDMQVRMMEKIEELTLYIIELHERVELLEEENKALKSEQK